MTQFQYDSSVVSLPETPAVVHLLGIGGVGVSGLARILLDRGYHVTGSDMAESPIVDDLRRRGISITIGHHAENVVGAELVVTTSAAPADNPELAAARRAGIPVIKRAALLGMLSNQHVGIAVAGSHGKSTTSGMLAFGLMKLGCDPSFAVGATILGLDTNARPGNGNLFITEADEYDYSFLWLRPRVAIITNIEHDHPDLFPTEEDVISAFQRFVAGMPSGGTLILNTDDPGCRRLQQSLRDVDLGVIGAGRNLTDWTLIDDEPSRCRIVSPDSVVTLSLSVSGGHNRLNATMALAAAAAAGIEPQSLANAFTDFQGVGRRFDIFGEVGGVTVIDDYAHHPTEIAATINAARERYPDATIHALFQPHTFSRTRSHLTGFANALKAADHVQLVEIYPARETDTLGMSSQHLADLISDDIPVHPSPEAGGEGVAQRVHSGDIVLVLGAGTIWRASPVIIDALQRG